MLLSGTARYALRAVAYLAECADDGPVGVRQLANELGIPRNYLSKIFSDLAREGVLTSSRGKTGGYQLAVPADRLPLIRVVAVFDPVERSRRCLLDRPICSDEHPCPAHAAWSRVVDDLAAYLQQTTVSDLMRR